MLKAYTITKGKSTIVDIHKNITKPNRNILDLAHTPIHLILMESVQELTFKESTEQQRCAIKLKKNRMFHVSIEIDLNDKI